MVENSLAMPIREVTETCYYCHKTGKTYKERWELGGFLWDKHKRQRSSFRELMAIYREWKQSGGFVDCEDCSGSGSWIKFI